MLCSSRRTALLGGLLFLIATPFALPAAAEIYPTDLCVSRKLDAAARACQIVLKTEAQATASHAKKKKHARRHAWGAERRRGWAERALARSWDVAEHESAAAGVSCEETTADAAAVWQAIEAGAADVAAAGGASCGESALQAAARACRGLLHAEARHLRGRAHDRHQDGLNAHRARVLSKTRHALQATKSKKLKAKKSKKKWKAKAKKSKKKKSKHAKKGKGKKSKKQKGKSQALRCDGAAIEQAVIDLADDLKLALTVSPAVPEEWTMYDPPEEVHYQGRTLTPICSRGTDYVYFAKRGTVNKLMVYYQGGGACWDLLTCDSLPVYKQATGPGDNPAGFQSGLFDLENPDNPFKDWNIVVVPYCTGDVHWGSAVVEHRIGDFSAVINHKGYDNAQTVEKWTREHFVAPEQVFVTGSSAGGYGAIVNSLPLQEHVYPSTDFAVVGDASNGVITQEFLVNDLQKWGIEANLPPWIPRLNVPLEDLDASELWAASADFYPQNRFANYTTSFDGGTGGQTGFYHVMLSLVADPGNVFEWQNWWRPSCEWNEQMVGFSEATAAESGNYRYYIGSGSRHTIWGNNKAYDDTTGGVQPFVDWLNDMLTDSPDWKNVRCEDCGTLLPGDPRPNPPEAPYVQVGPETRDQKIICD